MSTNTPHLPGRETSGHTGAGLIGDLDTGIEAGREGREARDRALERETTDAGDTSVAGGPGTSTPRGVSRIGSGTTGLNNYSPGSDLSARLDPDVEGSLTGTTGGERASAGTNDANRSSRDHGNSLDA